MQKLFWWIHRRLSYRHYIYHHCKRRIRRKTVRKCNKNVCKVMGGNSQGNLYVQESIPNISQFFLWDSAKPSTMARWRVLLSVSIPPLTSQRQIILGIISRVRECICQLICRVIWLFEIWIRNSIMWIKKAVNKR